MRGRLSQAMVSTSWTPPTTGKHHHDSKQTEARAYARRAESSSSANHLTNLPGTAAHKGRWGHVPRGQHVNLNEVPYPINEVLYPHLTNHCALEANG
jgi:hypothetical protein